jgi:hypothetical protein
MLEWPSGWPFGVQTDEYTTKNCVPDRILPEVPL